MKGDSTLSKDKERNTENNGGELDPKVKSDLEKHKYTHVPANLIDRMNEISEKEKTTRASIYRTTSKSKPTKKEVVATSSISTSIIIVLILLSILVLVILAGIIISLTIDKSGKMLNMLPQPIASILQQSNNTPINQIPDDRVYVTGSGRTQDTDRQSSRYNNQSYNQDVYKDRNGSPALFDLSSDSKIANLITSIGNPDIYDRDGLTLMHHLVRDNKLPGIQQLIARGADVDKPDILENTPLMYAARYGNTAVIQNLLDYGANINALSLNGNTALSIAADNGDAPMLSFLKRKGANAELIDKNGNSPIMKSSSKGHVDATKRLIEQNVLLNNRNNGGKTALALAAENGHGRVVKLLLEAGADPLITDNLGKDPIGNAEKFNHDNTADIIKKFIAQ